MKDLLRRRFDVLSLGMKGPFVYCLQSSDTEPMFETMARFFWLQQIIQNLLRHFLDSWWDFGAASVVANTLGEFSCTKFCEMTGSLKPIVSFKYKPPGGACLFFPKMTRSNIFWGMRTRQSKFFCASLTVDFRMLNAIQASELRLFS